MIVEYGSKKNCENKNFFAKVNYFKPNNPSEVVKKRNFDRSIFYKFKSKGKILIPIFPTYMSQEDIFLYFKNLEINSNIFDCIDSVKYSLNNQRYPLFIDMHIPHNFNAKKLRLKNEFRENYHFGRKEINSIKSKYENLNYKINPKLIY